MVFAEWFFNEDLTVLRDIMQPKTGIHTIFIGIYNLSYSRWILGSRCLLWFNMLKYVVCRLILQNEDLTACFDIMKPKNESTDLLPWYINFHTLGAFEHSIRENKRICVSFLLLKLSCVLLNKHAPSIRDGNECKKGLAELSWQASRLWIPRSQVRIPSWWPFFPSHCCFALAALTTTFEASNHRNDQKPKY